MRDYSLNPYNPITSSAHAPSRMKYIALIGIFLAVVLFVFTKRFFFQEKNSAQPKKSGVLAIKQEPSVTAQKVTLKNLESLIDKTMEPLKGSYSLYVVDINSGKEFGINENTLLTAASVNKIAILAALYNLAGKGEIELEKTITLQRKDIQDYGSGTIRYDPVGSFYSLKSLARLMMEKSDNTAAYILASEIIGMDKIQKLVDGWEMTQTDMEDNKSSAKDMSILLIKMFKGQVTNAALTEEMLGFMDKSDYDDRIPALLPEGTKVYHKTGDEVGKIHDVGIVDLKNKPYFIGIFTFDMSDDASTKQAMAQVSKFVYDAMK